MAIRMARMRTVTNSSMSVKPRFFLFMIMGFSLPKLTAASEGRPFFIVSDSGDQNRRIGPPSHCLVTLF